MDVFFELDLKEVIQKSFCSAVNWSNDNGKKHFSNALKSAYFVSKLGENLISFWGDKTLKKNVIHVDNLGKKHSGEWLLDLTIVKNYHSGNYRDFIKKIVWAVESESSTSFKAFNDDFLKLVHIKADNYLYLNGLNQKTQQGANNFIKKRVELAEKILSEIFPDSFNNPFYLGFWCSPCKKGNNSLWNQLNHMNYLQNIHLFKYEKNFREIK